MSVEALSLADLMAVKESEPCKVGKIIQQLTDTERADVETALAGPLKQYPHTKIAGALSKRVEYVSDSVVRIHRTGACSCGR